MFFRILIASDYHSLVSFSLGDYSKIRLEKQIKTGRLDPSGAVWNRLGNEHRTEVNYSFSLMFEGEHVALAQQLLGLLP